MEKRETSGIILVDKPQGWTSFDVVAKIRKLTGIKKVGHAGTLDPMATGLLLIFLGNATKAIQNFMSGRKGYEGEMVLGVKTETGDAEGKRISGDQMIRISREAIKSVFEKFTGEIEQVPPMYSAVKVKGQRLYELARKGIEVERESRRIKIFSLLVTHYLSPCVEFYVECSKGTYVRQLAADIGDDLGCGAHLSKLRRTYSHPFHISQALTIETIITLGKIGEIEKVMIPPSEMKTLG